MLTPGELPVSFSMTGTGVSDSTAPAPVAAGDRAGAALAVARDIASRITTGARWAGSACTWEAGGSEIGGRLSDGSAGVALFLVRLFEATHDGAYLDTARGALVHAVARERGEGAAHGWYGGTAGVAAVCAALGAASRDAGWLDEAVSLCRALDDLEQPPRVHDVADGEAGSILGLLAVHEATADERVLAAARRLGDGLLRKRRAEPEGISWNGHPAVVRNLLGLAHGAGGIGLALLELFRATGDERFFAGASESLRYEDSFYDPAIGDWPDLRHGALAAYLDAGRLRELREAVAADAFEVAPVPRPSAGWRYGTPGLALVRARFLEITRLERCRAALEHAAARCRERVLAPAVEDERTLEDSVFAAADALLECARVTGHAHDAHLAAQAVSRARSGEGASPGLLRGAAGIGLLHLRIASPRIPSPLLPGPAPPASDPPAVSDATATRAAVAGALEHFPRTEQALAGVGIRVRVDAAATPVSTAALRERLGEFVAALPAGERERVGEALALETLAYEHACAHAGRAEPLVRSLTRPRAERLDLADARVRLAPSARLFRAAHDGESVPHGGDAQRRARLYLVHDTPGGFVIRPLDDLGARLFSALEAATNVRELVEDVAGDIRTDAGAAEVRARLRDALRGAYEMGILEMADPHDLRPSDVTSALCTRCGECCRVRINIPGDAAYREFIAAVLEAPLRASYPDMVIRHERSGNREHVVLDLGYCHHLERGTDEAGHPTFQCGTYESRPEVCRDFNCVAWGRVQRMGAPGRTISDAALEKVAALKRALEGEAGA